MSAHRHEGRVGVHPDIVGASDSAYGDHTFVVPSRDGIALPSERFCPGETITRDEWERRHAGTYQTTNTETTPALCETSRGS